MKKYKIALIIEEINQSYQSAILDGIAASLDEFSFDVSAFVSFSGAMINPKHDNGEFNIFRLPDFRDFDGAILLTNTIAYQPVICDILKRIKEAGIPVVCIDDDVREFYHIGIDNKSAMRQITEHLINVHGFTEFAYISGPAENPESADRLSGFREVIEENNIPLDEEMIYYGDFRAHSGRDAIEYFIANGKKMPQAVICANDAMAVTAITKLNDLGYSVPDHIAVTGFDNTYNTHNYQIELTSVERPLTLSGKLACKKLYDHFQGREQERSDVLSMSARFTESCGCLEGNAPTINDYKSANYKNYRKFEDSQDFMALLNRISTALLGCNDLGEYVSTLKKYIPQLNMQEFYLCLCSNWTSHTVHDTGTSIVRRKDNIPKNYTDEFIVPIAYKSGEFYDVENVSRKQIIPSISDAGSGGGLYYHTPLHFGERCLGYMIVKGTQESLHNSMFESLCISIGNSLENIRKLIVLEYTVDKLGKLYAQDTFSGIYNRNGFVSATAQVYKDCVKDQRSVMLMFIDLDGLKKINDTHGHSVGDRAICNIAEVLTKSCVSGEIFCRFGGDEFIVFGADFTEEKAQALTAAIENNIQAINDKCENPFTLSASTGYVIDTPTEGQDIFRFVSAADKIMYTEKRKKKLSHYLKS